MIVSVVSLYDTYLGDQCLSDYPSSFSYVVSHYCGVLVPLVPKMWATRAQ